MALNYSGAGSGAATGAGVGGAFGGPYGAAIGAGIGGLAGLFLGKKKPAYDPYGGYTPEQQRIHKALADRLSGNFSPQYYSGQLNAGISPEELNAIRNYNAFSNIGGQTINDLSNLNDPQFEDRFRQEIADPTLHYFQQEIQPLIEESLPSFSTARANVVARNLGNLQGDILQQRSSLREAARNRALQAVAEGQNLGRTNLLINSVPREIQQAGLDREYQNYVQGNQAAQDNISNSLNFLGIGSGVQREPDNSTLERVLASAGTGAQIGSLFGGGGNRSNLQQEDQLQRLIAALNSNNSNLGGSYEHLSL